MANVAFTVGYPEPAHFVRAFKEVQGISPTEYKNSL
ncbi:helix-turn-helix domain-containing protein [Hungatella hathewayi]|uniref:Helix-turn-helix domain-containing protein n=1 Tax=Hungatella hathewayi TaxID=154046 RepID=A0AAW9WPD2_9FIRM|nr:helix-turn-helix transcriptional regulator [Hungatella hathewayi]MUB66436.1 helix-turn-helix domain-containing protein [Hungatella hathewayi]RHB63111.1 AraC family transcriptional regulator [Hungatella hathewayi]